MGKYFIFLEGNHSHIYCLILSSCLFMPAGRPMRKKYFALCGTDVLDILVVE
jgi:hypothetical protein